MTDHQPEPRPEGPQGPNTQPAAPYAGPPPYGPGMPPHLPPRPPRPAPVTAAMALWIVMNALLMVGSFGLYFAANGGNPPTSGSPYAGATSLVFLSGLVGLVLATQLARGSNGSRIALTILGGLQMFGLWTVLFIVPALILQYRPSSNAWFRAVNAPRFPPPRPPMPPPPPA